MTTLITLFAVGLAGGLVFDYFDLPGGPMTGAMLAVVIFKSFGSVSTPHMPHWLRYVVYGCVGVIVGNMYSPGMLQVVRETWPIMLLSTFIILGAGLGCAWISMRFGGMSAGGAYLATSPGGFNAIMALAGDAGAEAPMVMVYHLVRIYAIVLLSPLIAKLLAIMARV
ncbi:MAG: AbrB family transcriptional regulator [Desulfovibrio sp.]|nr:AbrB family transcriptional regulator [Desulfovibrio sp.]